MKSIDKILNLFYNPKTESINNILSLVKSNHKKIKEKTNNKVAINKFREVDYEKEITESFIPKNIATRNIIINIVSDLYSGIPKWYSERTMYNVAPPPVITTIVSKLFNAIYNPNLVIDSASGECLLYEKKVIKMISEFTGWDYKQAGGTFTFGGKATTIYAIRTALKKTVSNYLTDGITEEIVILSTETGHPSHTSDCEWLGIGNKSVKRIKVQDNGQIDLLDFEKVISSAIENKIKVPAIILTGGSTNNMVVDPIKEVSEIRDKIVARYNLKYIPHIHVDAVVGFPWIFFKDYDFLVNIFTIPKESLSKILNIKKYIVELKYADSFGIDFHKLGFCPYISSLFMLKKGKDLTGIENNSDFVFGENYPFKYTIENSRSADGPMSAYLALKTLGIEGFQIILSHLVTIATDLQHKLELSKEFEVINKDSLGSSVIFIPKLDNLQKTNSKCEQDKNKVNSYINSFISEMRIQGNPYYIDRVPPNSTGANPYPFVALKAYIMSPFSSPLSNEKFIEYLLKLKNTIDNKLDSSSNAFEDFGHPLK